MQKRLGILGFGYLGSEILKQLHSHNGDLESPTQEYDEIRLLTRDSSRLSKLSSIDAYCLDLKMGSDFSLVEKSNAKLEQFFEVDHLMILLPFKRNLRKS